MYVLLKMGIFHCYTSLPEGNWQTLDATIRVTCLGTPRILITFLLILGDTYTHKTSYIQFSWNVDGIVQDRPFLVILCRGYNSTYRVITPTHLEGQGSRDPITPLKNHKGSIPIPFHDLPITIQIQNLFNKFRYKSKSLPKDLRKHNVAKKSHEASATQISSSWYPKQNTMFYDVLSRRYTPWN